MTQDKARRFPPLRPPHRPRRTLPTFTDFVKNTFLGPLRKTAPSGSQTLYQAEQSLAVQPAYFYSTEYLLLQEQADWRNCPSELKSFFYHFGKELRLKSIPMYLDCVYRTPIQQAYLLEAGLTSETHLAHVSGAAGDFLHARRKWDLTPSEWQYLGLLGEDVIRRRQLRGVIEWGGNWTDLNDPAHWQYVEWTDLPHADHDAPPVRHTLRGLKSYGPI